MEATRCFSGLPVGAPEFSGGSVRAISKRDTNDRLPPAGLTFTLWGDAVPVVCLAT